MLRSLEAQFCLEGFRVRIQGLGLTTISVLPLTRKDPSIVEEALN